MRKFVNVVALFVLVATNVFTPISYAQYNTSGDINNTVQGNEQVLDNVEDDEYVTSGEEGDDYDGEDINDNNKDVNSEGDSKQESEQQPGNSIAQAENLLLSTSRGNNEFKNSEESFDNDKIDGNLTIELSGGNNEQEENEDKEKSESFDVTNLLDSLLDDKSSTLKTMSVGEYSFPELIGDDDSRNNNFTYNIITIGDYKIMDRNLGAKTEWDGTTWSVSSEADYYGYYYQWGNKYGFSSKTENTSAYTTNGEVTVSTGSTYYNDKWNKANPWSRQNDLWGEETNTEAARQGPCPTNWHVPSSGEWQGIYDAWNSRDDNSKDKGSPSKNFAYDLKLPPAGYRGSGNLVFYDRGSGGLYWSSSPGSASNAYDLYFYTSDVSPELTFSRSYGLPVRCFMNSPVPQTLTLDVNGGTPTESEIEADEDGNVTLPNATRGADENGERVFEGWFASTGMSEKIGNSGDVINLTDNMTVYAHWAQTITIRDPVNPGSGFTIMDRNLGAIMTGAGAGASTGSYGYHYQWGNNYGFDSSKLESILKSGIKVDVSSLSEYSEPIFITGYDTWMDPYKNLWGEGGQGPCPDGWHVPMKEEWSALDIYYKNTYNSGSDGFINYFNLPFSRHLGETAYWSDEIDGRYWSSTQDSAPVFAYALKVLNNNVYPDNIYIHIFGNSVRCFKNEFNAPSMNTITFDAQGGDVETGSISVVSGSTVNLSGYIASLDGWNFTGWNINSGAHEGMDSITVTGDVTLYAIFSKEMTSNFVLRDSNAASLDETTASCTAYNGGYCTVTAPTLTKKSGYTVDGWSADEGNEITTIFTGGNTFNSVTHNNTPITITFYQNGNGGNGSEERTCYKYNGESTCKIRSPNITLSEGSSPIGWNTLPNAHSSSWNQNTDKDVSYDESYYAITSKLISATFKSNDDKNLINGYLYDSTKSCTIYNNSTNGCGIVTPKIGPRGDNTPIVVGFTKSKEGTGTATVGSESNLTIYGGEIYYAHTKREKVDLTASWDGNSSTLGDTSLLTGCELPEVYDRDVQPTSCSVDGPTVTPNANTPTFVGFDTTANSTTNNVSYNTGTNKLTLTKSNTNNTWYVITTAPEKTLRITYGKGVGIAEISATSGSCLLVATYNGVAQTGCNVIAPNITVKPGYSNEDKIWTDKLNPSNKVRENQTITLTKDEHYTANAEYEAGTTIINYSIEYELSGGSIAGAIEAYTVEDEITLVNPTWEHHIFVGWTGGDKSSPEITIPTITVTIERGTIGDKKYYAKWYDDYNDNGINDDEEPHFNVRFEGGENGTLTGKLEYDNILSGLRLSDIQGFVIPTPIANNGYEFIGWNREININEKITSDIIITAQWKEVKDIPTPSGGGSSSGGGRRFPVIDDHGVADENSELEILIIDLDQEDEEQISQGDNDGTVDSLLENEELQGENINTYDSEQVEAYVFAKSNGITTTKSIEDAKMNMPITRIEMAKMLSYYAINVLGKKPDTSKKFKFKDVTSKLDKKYDNGVTLAYQLGIMGINVKNKRFRPNDKVTRAELTTALSRLLYNTPEGTNKSTKKYYEPHIAKLYNEGVITKTDPNIIEKRGYLMIMLMRSVSK